MEFANCDVRDLRNNLDDERLYLRKRFAKCDSHFTRKILREWNLRIAICPKTRYAIASTLISNTTVFFSPDPLHCSLYNYSYETYIVQRNQMDVYLVI